MVPHLRSFVAFGWIVMVAISGGCDVSGKYPPVAVEPAPPAAEGTVIATPKFVHWAQFPMGTRVTRRKTVTNPDGSITVTTTQRLIEKTDQKITVQQQKSVERPEGLTEFPPQELVFAASFRLPPNLTEEQFALPSLKAKLTGREKIELAGQTYDAEVFEWEEVNEAGPMPIKIWRSNAVPGQILREEMLIPNNKQESLEEITEIVIPSAENESP